MTEALFADSKEFQLALSAEDMADIIENRTRDLNLDPYAAYQNLSEDNKRAMAHLVKAAAILNDVFLQQDHPDNLRARQFLHAAAEAGNPAASYALQLFTMFNGMEGRNMYAPKTIPLALFKDKKMPEGGGFYPRDITKDELVAYVVVHPDQVEGILNNNTVIKRDGDFLMAEPYSVAYSHEMHAAADQLRQAADKTDHAGMASYLRLQAHALIEDTDPEVVFAAEKAWIELEGCPLEFTIGRESYKDGLSASVAADPRVAAILKEQGIRAQQKDLIGVRVGVVNTESEALIATYRDHADDFGGHMPLLDQYRAQAQASAEGRTTMVDTDLIALTGELAAIRGGIVIANNLPNPDKLSSQRGVGSRQTFHRQARNGVDLNQRQRILDALIDPAQRELVDVEYHFPFTVGHEGGHSFGPRTTADGRDKGNSLGEYGGMIEENKADLVSIIEADYLASIGAFTVEDTHKLYMTWIFKQLPSKQPDATEAHRSREIMQLNYFREKGAISFEKDGKLSIAPEKIAETAREMLTEVIQMQLAGDRSRALAFVEKYGRWNEALQYAADQIMKLQPRLYINLRQPLREKLEL